jgi:RPA family protein
MSAYKLPISELIQGNFLDGVLTTKSGFQVQRAWVAGIVTQKRADKYLSILVDDGTGGLRIRVFEEPERYQVEMGDIVEVAGYIREYNGRIYLIPDFIKQIDANTELLRRLEALKVLEELKKNPPEPPQISQKQKLPELTKAEDVQADESEKTEDFKPIVLEALKNEKTFSQLQKETGLSEENLNGALEELLDKGEVFEPKAGKFLAI